MDRDRFIRQRDVLPPDKLARLAVTAIGCGAVGSFTVLTLAKMGITDIKVYDGDIVEDHNLPNQWFRPDHLGMNKTEALQGIIHDFTGVGIEPFPRHYTREPLSGIVICCVDSMDTRLQIWREVKKFEPELYIDTRMGAEVGKVLVVHPSLPTSCRRYEEHLYPSSEAFHAPCTAKATIYSAAGLAAYVAATVAGYAVGRPVRSIVIDWVNMKVVGG